VLKFSISLVLNNIFITFRLGNRGNTVSLTLILHGSFSSLIRTPSLAQNKLSTTVQAVISYMAFFPLPVFRKYAERRLTKSIQINWGLGEIKIGDQIAPCQFLHRGKFSTILLTALALIFILVCNLPFGNFYPYTSQPLHEKFGCIHRQLVGPTLVRC